MLAKKCRYYAEMFDIISFRYYFWIVIAVVFSAASQTTYTCENLRAIMAYNFSSHTNIQFSTLRYVVHYTWRLYNSRLIAGLLRREIRRSTKRNGFQNVVLALVSCTRRRNALKSASRCNNVPFQQFIPLLTFCAPNYVMLIISLNINSSPLNKVINVSWKVGFFYMNIAVINRWVKQQHETYFSLVEIKGFIKVLNIHPFSFTSLW